MSHSISRGLNAGRASFSCSGHREVELAHGHVLKAPEGLSDSLAYFVFPTKYLGGVYVSTQWISKMAIGPGSCDPVQG